MTLKFNFSYQKLTIKFLIYACSVTILGYQILRSDFCFADVEKFELSLKLAEQRALGASDQVKALSFSERAVYEQANAQFSILLPKLTFNANYQYLTNVPTIQVPVPGFNFGIPFGAHNNYSIGPALSYVLWDFGSARNAYAGADLLAQSRGEDRKKGELQVLLDVRSAYLRLQLSLEELRLLRNSLNLAQIQNRDIETNFRAGAATKLDRVDSQREVINRKLSFEQKQAEVVTDFTDLLAIVYLPTPKTSRIGPAGLPGVELELNLDSLEASLNDAGIWRFSPPADRHPQLRSQELLAEASEKSAQALMDSLYPTVQVTASAVIQYPIGPVLQRVNQNIFAASLSMPLFEGGRTRHNATQKRLEAEAARSSRLQLKVNMDRDYTKAQELLLKLNEQQKLATEDVERSRQAAGLYYQSYKGGKLNLTDVLAANNRALQSEVNATRISAQILSQLIILKYLSSV